ncbi:MAG: hypothetical protein Q7U42_00590, partial [Parvibaculum sp.]|nr:hypothetical protein [Parvibaculum sp.]
QRVPPQMRLRAGRLRRERQAGCLVMNGAAVEQQVPAARQTVFPQRVQIGLPCLPGTTIAALTNS